jgi:hypothetical protein
MRGHYRPRVPTPPKQQGAVRGGEFARRGCPDSRRVHSHRISVYVITSNVGIPRRDQVVEAGVSTDDVVDDNVQDQPFRPAATDADVDNGSCSMMFDWVKSPAVLMLYQ